MNPRLLTGCLWYVYCFVLSPQTSDHQFSMDPRKPFKDSRIHPQEHDSRNQKQSNAKSKAGKLTKAPSNEQGSERFA